MKLEDFEGLAQQGYNRIPVVRTILADTETPLSAYLKLADQPYTYLFESVEGGEKWGRYSIIGLAAREFLEIRDGDVRIVRDGKVCESPDVDDALTFIENYKARFKVPEIKELPRFIGGLVGYFGYDTIRYIEPKLKNAELNDELGVPDILLMLSEEVLVFDNLLGKIHIIVSSDPTVDGAYTKTLARLEALEIELSERQIQVDRLVPDSNKGKTVSETQARSSFEQAPFQAAVESIKEYVLAGDVMQVVLSQRMTTEFNAKPINLYRALRSLNPSPYMFYMNLGDHFVVGSSPELLTNFENGEITVRPIAGTRRRGYSDKEDAALEKEMLNDPKEIAEHLMLIDLGRNDAGRISETGSVRVTEQMIVERFSHVLHMTSNVVGKAKANVTAIDVIKAVHPAGTLSGAPKVRAMEIIDELEPVKRGIYGGAVGYLGWNGALEVAIAIRAAVIKDGEAHVQVGAGIVADSKPELEWKETMNKARAVFGALDWVKQSKETSN